MVLYFISDSNITTNTTASFSDVYTTGWIFTLLVVLPENSYVIWLIVSGTEVASEVFSLNLSICELFLSLQCFFALLSRVYLSIWLVLGFMSGFSITGRGLFQCLICFERYLAVVHPVTFLKYKPLRYKVICSTAAWVIILITCVFAHFTFFQIHMFFFMYYFLCQTLVIFCIMMFCCLAVLRALKQSGPGDRKKQEENHMKRRAFNIIVMIVMSMLLMYCSYLWSGLSYCINHEIVVRHWTAGQFFFLLGGLVQPLLYLQRMGKLPFCKTL